MKIKTLDFAGKYGQEKLAIQIDSYQENQNLYISLWSKENDEFELFTDLTMNLGEKLKANESFVKTSAENEGLLSFIIENQLGTILPEIKRSGYCDFIKIAFDMKKLAEFDPDGVRKHMKIHDKLMKKKSGPEL